MLTEIINKAHENAVKRGVYDCKDCKGTGKTPQKNIIAKLREEIDELEKAFNRNVQILYDDLKLASKLDYTDKGNKIFFETHIKDEMGDELADIIIVCLAASKELNIPIIEHLQTKNKYNEVRNE